MQITIDFEALIKVMIDELKRQHPNEIVDVLKASRNVLGDSIKNNPKFWFSALGLSILGIDGKDY